MSEKKRLFSDAYLRKLIIPLIFEQALAITVGMADTMMVSSVGEAAVSGVSLVDMINNLIISMMAALATGGAVVTAQFLGANKQKDARESANQLFYTMTLFGLIFMAFAILFRVPLLRLFFGSIEADVMEDCLLYLWITALSFPFLAIYSGSAALFRSMGDSKITLVIAVIMNLINVIGNALCVFVFHMGVAGVAVPSLISRGIAAVISCILLLNRNRPVHYTLEVPRLKLQSIRRILYIGVPSGMENGMFELGRVIVVSIIAAFGTVQIAANGVANNLDALSLISSKAMQLAMITVIGQCVGAHDEEQIRFYTRKLMKWTYVLHIITDGLILLGTGWILQFYGLEAETLHLAKILAYIHNGFGLFMWPVAFVFPNMLRACNDVRYTMVVAIFSMVTFRIVGSFILGAYLGLGAIGVWIAMIIDWTFRLSLFGIRYHRGDWRRTAGLVE